MREATKVQRVSVRPVQWRTPPCGVSTHRLDLVVHGKDILRAGEGKDLDGETLDEAGPEAEQLDVARGRELVVRDESVEDDDEDLGTLACQRTCARSARARERQRGNERRRTRYAIEQRATYDVSFRLSSRRRKASGHRSVIDARIHSRRSRRTLSVRSGLNEWTTCRESQVSLWLPEERAEPYLWDEAADDDEVRDGDTKACRMRA